VLESDLAAATAASEESALLVAELSEQARAEADFAADLLARAESLARGLSIAEANVASAQAQVQAANANNGGSGGAEVINALRKQLQEQRAQALQADRLLSR
jgi:hypothetical protein